MTFVVLNRDLDDIEINKNSSNNLVSEISKYGDRIGEILETSIPDNGFIFKNWLEYIGYCYANHCVPNITPSDLTFTIMCVITKIVSDNPNEFQDMFTKSNEKISIGISSMSYNLPLEQYLKEIDKLAPIGIMDLMPKFTTDTDEALNARYSCFAEMLSPYYECYMYSFGIPGIKISGTIEDWIELKSFIKSMKTIFNSHAKKESNKFLIPYFDKISPIIDNFISIIYGNKDKHIDFLNNIYINTTCGSGGQAAIKGWICTLYGFLDNEIIPIMLYSLQNESHISTVIYKFNNEEYKLHYGINSADLEEQIINEKVYKILNTNYNKTVCKIDIQKENIEPELKEAYFRMLICKKEEIYQNYIYRDLYGMLVTYPGSYLFLCSDIETNRTENHKKYNKITKWWFKNFRNYHFFSKILLDDEYEKISNKIDNEIKNEYSEAYKLLKAAELQKIDKKQLILGIKIKEFDKINFEELINKSINKFNSIIEEKFEGISFELIKKDNKEIIYKIRE